MSDTHQSHENDEDVVDPELAALASSPTNGIVRKESPSPNSVMIDLANHNGADPGPEDVPLADSKPAAAAPFSKSKPVAAPANDTSVQKTKISRCQRAFYCSKECQSSQWKAGHKQCCRKAGEIKIGDYLKIHGLVKAPEYNGTVVQIISARPEGRWETRIPGGDKSVSISSNNLEPLRPLK